MPGGIHPVPPLNTRDVEKLIDLAVAGYDAAELRPRFEALPAVLRPLALQRLADYVAGADAPGDARARVADALALLQVLEA